MFHSVWVWYSDLSEEALEPDQRNKLRRAYNTWNLYTESLGQDEMAQKIDAVPRRSYLQQVFGA